MFEIERGCSKLSRVFFFIHTIFHVFSLSSPILVLSPHVSVHELNASKMKYCCLLSWLTCLSNINPLKPNFVEIRYIMEETETRTPSIAFAYRFRSFLMPVKRVRLEIVIHTLCMYICMYNCMCGGEGCVWICQKLNRLASIFNWITVTSSLKICSSGVIQADCFR